jgi:ankyrin repeat protein
MDARKLPVRPNLEQYKKQAKEIVKAWNGDEKSLRKINELYGRAFAPEEFRERVKQHYRRLTRSPFEEENLTLANAQFLLAREHAFDSWPKFAAHIEALNEENSLTAKFEAAADAIAEGDVKKLGQILQKDPSIVHARSDREHRSTLLHYVSANGVEDFRQVTPRNILEIAKLLLDAGAEVNAESEAYGGGSTTLGLAATSAHPRDTGVQNDLLEVLLGAGAKIDAPAAGGNQHSAVRGSLANGCPEAARYLAAHGARLDLVGAAGIGRLDVVKSFFDEQDATKEQPPGAEEALLYASGYGQRETVEFLLDRGVDIQAADNAKQTALHWALFTPQPEIVELLLRRGARLDAVNTYGGDALGQALWSLVNNDHADGFPRAIEILLEAGAETEEGTIAWLWRQPKPSAEVKAKVEEILRRFGAVS